MTTSNLQKLLKEMYNEEYPEKSQEAFNENACKLTRVLRLIATGFPHGVPVGRSENNYIAKFRINDDGLPITLSFSFLSTNTNKYSYNPSLKDVQNRNLYSLRVGLFVGKDKHALRAEIIPVKDKGLWEHVMKTPIYPFAKKDLQNEVVEFIEDYLNAER